MIRRLQFTWWGRFWRGWWQWGRGAMIVADKDYSVQGSSWHIGPLGITWWDRANWRDFCFTKEESAAEDERDREIMNTTGVQGPLRRTERQTCNGFEPRTRSPLGKPTESPK